MINPAPPGVVAVFNVVGVAATVWQACDVAPIPHPPENENSCILGLAESRLAPIELSVIDGYAVCATKLYHTSGDAALPQAGNPAVAVAFIKVPAIFEQVVALVNKVAPEHRSLDGGAAAAVKQILKLATVPVPDGFELKFEILT